MATALLQADEVLVIATSAPADRPTYRRDMLNCLCYPDDALVHFYYRKRWIEDAFLTRYCSSFDPARDSGTVPAIIVFCDSPNNPAYDFHFYPFRFAKLQALELQGDLATADADAYVAVTFTLDRFVCIDAARIGQLIQTWQRWALTSTQGHYPRPARYQGQADSKFVYVAGPPAESQNVSEMDSWFTLAENLAQANYLQSCVFFRITGIKQADGSPLTAEPPRQPGDARLWPLVSGKSYRVDLQFHRKPDNILPYKALLPRVTSQNMVLSQLLSSTIGMDPTPYFMIYCKSVTGLEFSSLIIEDPDDHEERSARAEFPLVLRPPPWLLFGIVTLLFLGALSSGLSSDVIAAWAAKRSYPAVHATAIAGAVKILGAFLVGLGAWLGFRKVPA